MVSNTFGVVGARIFEPSSRFVGHVFSVFRSFSILFQCVFEFSLLLPGRVLAGPLKFSPEEQLIFEERVVSGWLCIVGERPESTSLESPTVSYMDL